MQVILLITVEGGSNFADYLSLLCSFLTFILGIFALKTWKKEKEYSFRIEALARSRSAESMIHDLRNPVSWDTEIDDKIKEKFVVRNKGKELTPRDYSVIIFESRMAKYKDSIKEYYDLRERSLAYFGDNNPISMYYHKILTTVRKLTDTHSQLIILDDPNFTDRNKETSMKRIELFNITIGRQNDEISTTISKMREDLSGERRHFGWLGLLK